MQDPTREAAFDLLTAVLAQHRTLDMALGALPSLAPRDRAAAHRLAATVLRWHGTLDAVLEPFLRRAPPEPVRLILRLGAAGSLLLATPPHAAVATAVTLARQRGLAPFAGLINAVLRRVVEKHSLEGLDSARLDTPSWLWSSWGKEARAIADAHHHEAPLDLSLRPSTLPPPGAALLPNGTARLAAGTGVTDLPGFAEGAFWVQDAAAALPARLLAPRPGERIADLCAAPGGKTAQLAMAGALVTAVERDGARLARLRENLARLRLAADCVEADATAWRPATADFDAVLLDAPCTATGTIRRHPDLPHLRRPQDVDSAAATQDALLDAAARLLRPGGRLVYAVCSLQPEEGAARIEAALARHAGTLGLRRDAFRAEELPGLRQAITGDGDLRTHPGLWADLGGMDGFFVTRLIRS